MLKNTIQDAFKRLIEPSIDREIRSDLTEKAEEQAAKNEKAGGSVFILLREAWAGQRLWSYLRLNLQDREKRL